MLLILIQCYNKLGSSRHESFRRLVRVLQSSSSPYFMFVFWKDNPRGIHFYRIRQIPCRTRGTRAQKLFWHPPFRMDGFVHEHLFSFCKHILLSGWRKGNALAYHRCDPGSIPGIGMWDGHVVRRVGYLRVLRFPPTRRPPNANIRANEHD